MARRRDSGLDEDGWPEGMDRPRVARLPPIDSTVEVQRIQTHLSPRLLDNGSSGTSIVTVDSPDPVFYPMFECRGNPLAPDETTVFATREYVNQSYLTDEYSEPGLTLVVEWGIQNFSAVAELDLINGMVFSLMASYLKMAIRTEPAADKSSGQIRITAGASYGIRPAHAPPQKTMRGLTNLGPTDESTVNIPAFARGVYPVVMPNGEGQWCNFILTQNTAGGIRLSEHPYISDGVISPIRIPLLNDAQKVSIVNTDGVKELVRVNFIFDLSF